MATYLELLKLSNIELPPEEIDASVLYGVEIHNKIKDWHKRYERHASEMADLDIPSDFMELIARYPVSMCRKEMNNTIKLLIALFYFYHPIDIEPFKLKDMDGDGSAPFNIKETIRKANEFFLKHYLEAAQPSYEHLTLIFDKSKATVFEAIKDRGEEAKQLIEEGQLKRTIKRMARDQLIQEEKNRIKTEEQNERENAKQPNEPHTTQ